MIHGSGRHLVVGTLSVALGSCASSSPTRPEAAFVDVTFDYTSTLPVGDGDPAEAGFCAHHALGASRLELWRGGVLLDTLFMRTSGEPPRAVVTAQQLPVDTALVAVVWDLQCCTHTGPCWPTEELSANGVRLTRVVSLTDGEERRGLAFQVNSDGRVVQ